MQFKVNIPEKKIVADWPEPDVKDFYVPSRGGISIFEEGLYLKAMDKYNSRPSYAISPKGLKFWKNGQVLEEGEFELRYGYMNMYAKKGTKVTPVYKDGKACGGYDYDQEKFCVTKQAKIILNTNNLNPKK